MFITGNTQKKSFLSGSMLNISKREIDRPEAVLLLRMSTLTLPLSDWFAPGVALYMIFKLTPVLSLFTMMNTFVLYPHAFGIDATASLDYSKTPA